MDWQTIITFSVGAAALVYVGRRWWPGLAKLIMGAPAVSTQAGCADKSTPTGPSASCSHGCGNCGQGQTSSKDHRVHVVRRTTD
ncbi:MAG: hypothetical protein Q7U28_13765 [Aquabacterium sp.]|nr:hypothetical protein [Aquabacterium sp.]